MSPFPQSVADTRAISTVFLVPSPVVFCLFPRSEESQEATMDSDSVIKCPEPG